jgi:tetratricopeptide (TPR) repeat protein
MLMRRFLVSVASLALLLSSAAPGQDTVTLKDGTTKQGSVQEWNYNGLKMTVAQGGGTTTIKPEDIGSVTLVGPKEYKQGEEEYHRGKGEEVAATLGPFIDKKTNRAVLRAEALWMSGQGYLRSEKADDGIKTLKTLMEEFPQTHHLDDAITTNASVHVRTGKAQDAVSFLEAEEGRVAKLSESAKIVDGVKITKARAYLLAGDAKKAKTEATTLAGGTSSAAGAAKVLLGDIAVAEKQIPEAEKYYNDAKKVVTTRADRAACFNGLGTILLEKGKEARSPDQIRDALMYFLRTALVEIPEAGDSTEAHETGLYNTAVCFQYLGELGAPSAGGSKGPESKGGGGGGEAKTDDAQARNLQRARENFRRLIREYPQSKYASDAQTRLQKLGG